MPNFDQASHSSAFITSDDDASLFRTLCVHALASKILRIKRNDPKVKSLSANLAYGWNESARRRLGCILRQNTSVEELILWGCDLDVSGLCVGLQHNRCTQKLVFGGINLRDTETLNSLVLF